MRVIFIDTNLFLHCKKIEQIPWKEISEGQDILLLIPRTVIREIDRLKGDGNQRRAKRARSTNRFFDSILTTNKETIILQKESPHTEITFSESLNNNRARIDKLDPTKPDDCIVEEALIYQNNNPDNEIFILSNDTGIKLTAKDLKIETIGIPDSWFLPYEKDRRDKKIDELEKRIKELEKTYPAIEINVIDNNEKIKNINISIPNFNELSTTRINELVTETQKICPQVMDHEYASLLAGILSSGPTKSQITEYNREYSKWKDEINFFFSNLHKILSSKLRFSNIGLIILNTGNKPAKDLRITFSISKGLYIAPQEKDLDDYDRNELFSSWQIPSPPTPPQIETLSQQTQRILTNGNFISSLKIDQQKDKTKFFWEDYKISEYRTELTKTCEQFLHRMDPEIIGLKIFSFNWVEKCSLSCTVSAENLPNPVKITWPIRVEYYETDIENNVWNLIEEFRARESDIK